MTNPATHDAPQIVKHWTESEPVRLAGHRAGRVYLAGPMTGLPEFNFPAFNAEAAILRAQALTVINPAEHGIVEGAEWADYLRHDIAGLASCERIHLLRGWENSKGARLEVYIAQQLGMVITRQEGAALQSAQPAGHSCIFHAAPLVPGDTLGPQAAVCVTCGQPPRVLTTQPAAQEVCAHRWCHFGDQQPRRRCIDCNVLEPAPQQATPEPVAHTYASTQATNCAGCGEHKHTPLRIDAMGGYVCLTCIDNKLGSLLGEFGYPEPDDTRPAPGVPEGFALAQAEFNRAIDFAIKEGIGAAIFLDAWRHGDTSEWPEFAAAKAKGGE